MVTKRTSPSLSQRRARSVQYVKRHFARAEYVTPRIAFDKAHAGALRRYMKREKLGVSDAIRAAIMAVAVTPTTPAAKPPAKAAKRAGTARSRSSAPHT